jgi:hypothetical protein
VVWHTEAVVLIHGKEVGMKTDEILTPLSDLQDAALNLVMMYAPLLDIETSVRMAKAIVLELISAQSDAAKRAVAVVVAENER